MKSFIFYFLSFAKNIDKNVSGKYKQKPLDSDICAAKVTNKSGATEVATDALKTTSKRAIQETATATGDLIGNNKCIITKCS